MTCLCQKLNKRRKKVCCVRYKEDFVTSRFCFIHFTVILDGLKKIVRYTEEYH